MISRRRAECVRIFFSIVFFCGQSLAHWITEGGSSRYPVGLFEVIKHPGWNGREVSPPWASGSQQEGRAAASYSQAPRIYAAPSNTQSYTAPHEHVAFPAATGRASVEEALQHLKGEGALLIKTSPVKVTEKDVFRESGRRTAEELIQLQLKLDEKTDALQRNLDALEQKVNQLSKNDENLEGKLQKTNIRTEKMLHLLNNKIVDVEKRLEQQNKSILRFFTEMKRVMESRTKQH